MKCVLCNQRSGKRYCPGVRGYICGPCCGTEREVSIECPFDCVYLQEAHRRELERAEPPTEVPYAGHEVPRDFVHEKEPFIGGLSHSLLRYAMNNPGMVDADAQATLDALVRTYETLSSGLVYETLPEGSLRVNLYRELQKFFEDWRKQESQRAGMEVIRDGDVLRSLVFLGRLALVHDNRRPRGKAFVSFLRRVFPEPTTQQSQRLIIPGA